MLIAQEFVYTEFDWRVGVLNREPLYACQYYMSRGHWQIYNHAAQGQPRKSGGFDTMAVTDAPPEVIKLALQRDAADRRRALRRRPQAGRATSRW